ncbi:hypothetical protein ACOXXX_16375 [Thalassococcus sp. BH17M4-6]|uniref:hypothetical protein n=1 Tax=Thalassococcus sp. BH17M4-6 TaxID=3413148 RepID=UPI003BE8D3FA
MDLVGLVFYGCVCGLLSLAGPKLGRAPLRFGAGVLVGVVAVTVLPMIRNMLG